MLCSSSVLLNGFLRCAELANEVMHEGKCALRVTIASETCQRFFSLAARVAVEKLIETAVTHHDVGPSRGRVVALSFLVDELGNDLENLSRLRLELLRRHTELGTLDVKNGRELVTFCDEGEHPLHLVDLCFELALVLQELRDAVDHAEQSYCEDHRENDDCNAVHVTILVEEQRKNRKRNCLPSLPHVFLYPIIY